MLSRCGAQVVKAEPLRCQEAGVFGIVKGVLLPWYNAFRFLMQNVARLAVRGLTIIGTAAWMCWVRECRRGSHGLDARPLTLLCSAGCWRLSAAASQDKGEKFVPVDREVLLRTGNVMDRWILVRGLALSCRRCERRVVPLRGCCLLWRRCDGSMGLWSWLA